MVIWSFDALFLALIWHAIRHLLKGVTSSTIELECGVEKMVICDKRKTGQKMVDETGKLLLENILYWSIVIEKNWLITKIEKC